LLRSIRFIMRAVIESSTRRIFFRRAGASGAERTARFIEDGALRTLALEVLLGARSEGDPEVSEGVRGAADDD
jgi:hypothetical protein